MGRPTDELQCQEEDKLSLSWNYDRVLDYAAERIFARKVGGGYIFIHRLPLEHFAKIASA